MIWPATTDQSYLMDRLGGRLDVTAARNVVLQHLDEAGRPAHRRHRPAPADRPSRRPAPGGTRRGRWPPQRCPRPSPRPARCRSSRRRCSVRSRRRRCASRTAFSASSDLAEESQVPGQCAGLLPQLVFVAAAHDQDLDCPETARPLRAARPSARPCPCAARRSGRGTAPTCPAAGIRRAGSPWRTTPRRRRWGSRRRPSRAPPSASAGPGRTPRCGRRSSRARAAGCLERPTGSAISWSTCGMSRRWGPRRSSARASTGSARSARAGVVRRSRRRSASV